MKNTALLLILLVVGTSSWSQTKNTLHLFAGRSLGQPSIVPMIIAKHQAKYPAGIDYNNQNFGGTFRIRAFADRTFEIATGFNVVKRSYTCYDMLVALPSSDQYIGYHGDFFFNQPRNVRMNFNTYFLPIQFNYNFAGYKKIYHQVGLEYQVGYRDFSFLVERESGVYTDNFGSLYRPEDLNLMFIGKTIQLWSESNGNEVDDYGIRYNLKSDPYDQREPTPILFDGNNLINSIALHYKFTYKVNEVFSVYSKFHLQHIFGKNSFMNQSMIYNIQFGVSLLDDPLFKFIRRQLELRKTIKQKKQ